MKTKSATPPKAPKRAKPAGDRTTPKPKRAKAKAITKAPKRTTCRRALDADMPALFDAIAGGQSVRAYCARLGIDSPSAHRLITASRALGQDYAHAREMRGDGHAEDVLAVANKVVAGTLAPDAGRVAIDALKWIAARMAPKTLGDRKTIDVNVMHDLSGLTDEELADLERLRRRIAVAE